MVSKASRSVNVIMTLSYVKGRLGVHVKTSSPLLGGVIQTQSNQEGWVVESPQGRLSFCTFYTVDKIQGGGREGYIKEKKVLVIFLIFLFSSF